MNRYTFRETGNKTIDKTIKDFDKQIKREYKLQNGVKENCQSYIKKLIYCFSLNLTIDDWRIIRSGDYWDVRDSLTGIKKDKFTLKRIVKYLETKI